MFSTDRILEAAEYDLKGKRFLVTGASGGIGSAAIKKILASGGIVYSNSRRKLSFTHEQLVHSNLDISKDENIIKLVDKIDALDGVVYSAGSLSSMPIRFASRDKINEAWNINYFSAVILSSQLIKKRKIKPGASFVFLSSISSEYPYIGGSMYTGSKAALENFSKVLAMELKSKKVRCNCLAPAMVKTEMFEKGIEKGSKEFMQEHIDKYPLGAGEPEDLAQAICFLLSDASRWINGITLTMDGGFLLQGS